MKYELTIFKNVLDKKTHRKMTLDSWDAFENLMCALSKLPGLKPQKGDEFNPAASVLITPAIFKPNTFRSNANVICWGGWAALDVDNYEDFDDAIQTFKDVNHIIYNSASSSKEHPKFRVIFPLSRPVKADEIRHFWYSLNMKFNSLGDKQTKDLSRMYYVPAQYPDAFNIFISERNKTDLDVDALCAEYDYAKSLTANTAYSNISPEMQAQVDAYRKEKLTNTKISWSGIDDCPFINKKLMIEYRAITETGWYAKMYQILVSAASRAIKQGYPINANQLAALGRELDSQTGGWYKDRPLEIEAERAIDFAFKNV